VDSVSILNRRTLNDLPPQLARHQLFAKARRTVRVPSTPATILRKPWEALETITVDGITQTLARHDREFLLLADGLPLMSSRTHGSEDDLATIGCRRAR
jgi:hypothetical protein